MKIQKAIRLLIDGHKMTRKHWSNYVFLEYDEKSSHFINKNFLSITEEENIIAPWVPEIEDLFADDWIVWC